MPELESNNGNPYHKSNYAKQILNQDSNETKIITLGWSKGKDTFRSSREVFYEKGVLKHFAKFKEKHLCQSLFFNKVAGLRSEKKSLSHSCFPVNFAKCLRTAFLIENLRWPLLYIVSSRIFLQR